MQPYTNNHDKPIHNKTGYVRLIHIILLIKIIMGAHTIKMDGTRVIINIVYHCMRDSTCYILSVIYLIKA